MRQAAQNPGERCCSSNLVFFAHRSEQIVNLLQMSIFQRPIFQQVLPPAGLMGTLKRQRMSNSMDREPTMILSWWN